MKWIHKLIISVMICFVVYGFFCPHMISAKSDELVICGVILALGLPVLIGFWFKKEIKNIIGWFK